MIVPGVTTDVEDKKMIKFLNRGGYLEKKLSSKGGHCEFKERELRGIAKHDLSLDSIYDILKSLLEHAGYKGFGHNGFTKDSKEVRLEGEAYSIAKGRYDLLKD